jgi:enoyl-CoA hydratase/carnithine racemase
MAFDVKQVSETSRSVRIGEKLWLKEDGETVVADGDPSAATLLAVEGDSMSVEDAKRYGLVKQKQAAANKQSEPAANKARKTRAAKRKTASRKKA